MLTVITLAIAIAAIFLKILLIINVLLVVIEINYLTVFSSL